MGYSGLFGAVQDMLTNAELRQANAYAGRILLSASCVKVQAPLPMGVRSTRAVHEPPQVEYALWVDVYEVSCNTVASSELQADVSFGPHVLKSPPLLLEEAGSYTLEAAQGRMQELKVYLPGTSHWPQMRYPAKALQPNKGTEGTGCPPAATLVEYCVLGGACCTLPLQHI